MLQFKVRYPLGVAHLLAALASALAAIGATVAVRRGELKGGERARATAWLLGVALVSGALSFVAWRLLLLDPVLGATGRSGPHDPTWSRAAIVAVGLAGALLVRSSPRTARAKLAPLTALSLLAVAAWLVAPGASRIVAVNGASRSS